MTAAQIATLAELLSVNFPLATVTSEAVVSRPVEFPKVDSGPGVDGLSDEERKNLRFDQMRKLFAS